MAPQKAARKIAREGIRQPQDACEKEDHDPVNHPRHYTHGGIECIDAIEAQLGPAGFVAFLRGQVAKYNWRLLHKGNAVMDGEKLAWYVWRLQMALVKLDASED